MNGQQLEQAAKRSRTLSEDRALLHIVMALNEEIQDIKRTMKAMAEAFEKLTEISMANHAINLKLKDELERNFARNDDLNPATRAIGRDGGEN
jgi:hypothetical protein